MTDLRVDFCGRDAASWACRKWHYSRCIPNQKAVTFGVWENGAFVGAIVYGDGANPGLLTPYGLSYTEGCELVRVALTTHAVPVSAIVSRTLPLLRAQSPGLRLIVSFADPERGHHGGIYQAMSWLYLGQTTSADEYIVLGRRMHGRALRSTRSTHPMRDLPTKSIMEWTQQVIDPNVRSLRGSSKHRYAYPLDRQMRRRLTPLALPFPRAGEGSTVSQPASGRQVQVQPLPPAQ